MGVKDLWQLLEKCGAEVRLDELEGLVLAVDVSLWLHQIVKGMRTAKAGAPCGPPPLMPCQGGVLENAHILGMLPRICSLLLHNIKPVFVFDGKPPALKLLALVWHAYDSVMG